MEEIKRWKCNHKTGKWGFIIAAETPDEAISKINILTPKDQWLVTQFPAPETPNDIYSLFGPDRDKIPEQEKVNIMASAMTGWSLD